MQHHPTHGEWLGSHSRYLADKISRSHLSSTLPTTIDPADPDRCPETFAVGTSFFEYDGSLHLIRIEDVGSFARLIRKSPADVMAAATQWLSAPHSPDAEVWRDFVADRNSLSAIRPMFAALLEDVEKVFDAPGWPDKIRDVLGLLHLNPGATGGNIDILVFRYPVNSVIKLRGTLPDDRPLAPPTVLDMPFSTAFCPGPKGLNCGFVIDLSCGGNSPRREVIHPTSPYEAAHLWKMGTITKSVLLTDVPMARALHQAALRDETGRTDFARKTDPDLII